MLSRSEVLENLAVGMNRISQPGGALTRASTTEDAGGPDDRALTDRDEATPPLLGVDVRVLCRESSPPVSLPALRLMSEPGAKASLRKTRSTCPLGRSPGCRSLSDGGTACQLLARRDAAIPEGGFAKSFLALSAKRPRSATSAGSFRVLGMRCHRIERPVSAGSLEKSDRHDGFLGLRGRMGLDSNRTSRRSAGSVKEKRSRFKLVLPRLHEVPVVPPALPFRPR